MRLSQAFWRSEVARRALSSLLDARVTAMPKVPVTSKKARTVMSTEPLLPASVREGLGTGKRRSSRLAKAAQQAGEVRLAPAQLAEAERSADTKPDMLPADAARQPVKAAAKKASAKASKSQPRSKLSGEAEPLADVVIKAEPADVKAETADPAEKPKKRRRKVKSESDGTLKAKQEAVALVDEIMATDEAALAEDLPAPQPPKPRKNRRAPAGYAVRGEDVDYSAAGRRARLKAAVKRTGDTEPGEVPKVLGDEIRRMCEELGDPRLGETAPWHRAGGAVGGRNWWTGCHVSTSGGMERAVINAASIGCRAFALDTRCKMRWESPPMTDETVAAFKAACEKFGYGPEQILPHGSYLINLASPDSDMANKGFGGFLTELQRCERLGLTMYNFHPGSTTGICTHEESMDRIAEFINRALEATKGVTVVLENMASIGNIVGGRLWHLRYIIDRVHDKSRIGFCIDTCHLFSSGKDLRTDEACSATFQEIDDVVGLRYLKGMHINDSKTPFDSHRDRHENIGRGSIPLSTFRWIMNNPKFQGIPLIMETPVQEREPPVNYKKSLELGSVVWKDPDGPYGVGTDRRDVIVLNSLIEEPCT